MGTNFFAKIIPTKERKETLKMMIENNDFRGVLQQTQEMYGSVEPRSMKDIIQGEIHLGKRSGGWKFLWNPNIYQIRRGHSDWIENKDGSKSHKWVSEPDEAYYIYPLTKKGIKEFIDREDVEIYDEYGVSQDKEQFFKEALEWVTWSGKEAWDSDSYYRDNPKERRWSCKNEYTDFLESLGYKLSEDKADFYSDGLRFATTTDFS